VDGITPETCDECGFDARRWRVRDAVSFLGALGFWWEAATDGIPADRLNGRPAPGVWSALEYGGHGAVVTAMCRWGIEAIAASDGVELPPLPEDDGEAGEHAVLDADKVVGDLEREGHALAELAKDVPKAAWAHVGHHPGGVIQAEAALFHAVHDASHHMLDVSRGLATTGMSGTVVQINANDGGVPKLPVTGAEVTRDGLVGDRQADRKHHGRPFQALSLWSADVIAELAALGHPIAAGSAGENITLAGIDWAALRPGTLLSIGESLVAELSYPATPCRKQTRWFSDGDFGRIDYGHNPQWTRWYAWVREPGIVKPGDRVA
jgi:MOSC domain-containing protein YiiM